MTEFRRNHVPPPPVPNSHTAWQKVRRDLRLGRAHGFAGLVEEHDWNPAVRLRRSARAVAWRARNGRTDAPTTTFILGAQRSGTNMMVYGLANAPEVVMLNEGDGRAYDGFQLRDDATVLRLVRSSGRPHVVLKPLLDSHRASHLLDLTGMPGATRAVWAFRDVDGRVRSYLAKFGDINLRVLAAYARGDLSDHWQLGGMSDATAAFVRSLDYDRMSPESGAALFWYVRNRIYLDQGLDQRADAILASYDDFLADPEGRMRRICEFIGLSYRHELVAHIEPRPPRTTRPLEIDPAIRARCDELGACLAAAMAREGG